MVYDLKKIEGPRHSKRQNFEELIAQLASADGNAKAVDGSGGDRGIDCFIELEGGKLQVFQSKYFVEGLSKSHRRQIKQSLETVLKNPKVVHWVLCLPINLTLGEIDWFRSLSAEIKLDWWDETKIFTLLAKYPEIAHLFFPPKVEIELVVFEQTITGLLNALNISRKGPFSNSLVHCYFERAIKLSHVLLQDSQLIPNPLETFIGLDFSEIWKYLHSVDRNLTGMTTVNYYLQNSPHPIYLLPGAVVEIHHFLMKLINHGRGGAFHESLNNHENSIRIFIECYEKNPYTSATEQAYDEVIKYLGSVFSSPYILQKLTNLLNSNKLNRTPEEIGITLESSDVESVYERLAIHGTRQRMIIKMRDARDLVYLNTYAQKTGFSCRTLSSDLSLKKVSLDYLGERCFVRDSSEYAHFVYASTHLRHPHDFEAEIGNLIEAATRLNDLWDDTLDLVTSNVRTIRPLSRAFDSFAPFYQGILRPVDEMIENTVTSLTKSYFLNFHELYLIFNQDSDIVKSFKNWWDYMCQALKIVDEELQSHLVNERITAEYGLLEPYQQDNN